MIMCPTRELCQQVYVETKRYGRHFNAKITALLGGESKHEQWKELRKGVDILIATPGRLIDLYKKKAFNFLRTTFVVIDEADKMFGMGFGPQMKAVMNQIRPDRQTLLFSATYKDKVKSLSLEYLQNPVQIFVGGRNLANQDVKQEVVILEKMEDKMEWLIDTVNRSLQTINTEHHTQNMLKAYEKQMGAPDGSGGLGSKGDKKGAKKKKILIFVNHIRTCKVLQSIFEQFLQTIPFVILHGDKLQYERTNIIRKFKKDVNVMIATDVASRGLDIPDIKFVINYENPKDMETYVHRIGRTGRAGNKEGVAITCILKKETIFAAKLARQFERMGLAIPPDLHNLAYEDPIYREKLAKKDMGFGPESHKSSQMLKRALKAGQKGKTGLGFKNQKKQKISKKKKKEDLLNKMYSDRPKTLNDEYREMVDVLAAEEYKIKENELLGKDKKMYTVKKRVSRFTDAREGAGGEGDGQQPRQQYRDVQVSAAEMQKLRYDEMSKNMKNNLRQKFRSSFVKSGVLDLKKEKGGDNGDVGANPGQQ